MKDDWFGSKSTGINIDSGIWFKSSKDSGVEIGLRIGFKQKNWDSYTFSINSMWFWKIGDSISWFISTGFQY